MSLWYRSTLTRRVGPLIGTDTGEGSLTTSGYPAQVLKWHRGQDLSGTMLYFAGETDDVAVRATVDPTPGWERNFASRAVDFYNSREFVEVNGELVPIEVPDDCDVMVKHQWIFIG